MSHDCCILGGSGGEHLTEEVCGLLGVPSTGCTHARLSGGECHVRIHENIRGRDAYIVQSTCHPVNDNIMELSLMVSALRRASAERVIAVMPYYGYGRQTRKLRSREPISAADVATIFEGQGLDQILTIDLHAGQIAGFFSPRCSLDNLSVIPAVARFFWKRGVRNPVVVAPHATGVARAKELLDALTALFDEEEAKQEVAAREAASEEEVLLPGLQPGRVPPSLAMLLRDASDASGAKRLELIGEVEGRDVVIVDSIIDSGGTVARGSTELRARGAARVFAFATHGLFTGARSRDSAFDTIANAPVELVVTTNTVPNVATTLPPAHPTRRKLVILSVAPVIAHCLAQLAGLPPPEVDPSAPVYSMHGLLSG